MTKKKMTRDEIFDKLLEAHRAEMKKKGAAPYNTGKVTGRYFILSTTSRGWLETKINPSTKKITHVWEAYKD